MSGSQRLACDHYTTNNSQIWLTRDWKIFLRVCSSLSLLFARSISSCRFVVALRETGEKFSRTVYTCDDDANESFHRTGQIESNYDEITDSFDAMELKPELLRGM